jgi:NADPH2 dehydrogenase
MAPLTRLRADPKTLIPNPLAKDYYAQRASKGGLLISEATFISPEASGLKGAPGIFTQDQCDEWKKINSAVHEKGGFHFCQFWFLGRVADPTVVNRVLAASDIQADKSKPVELTVASEEDLERILKDYKKAAEYALEAGFDGIELHGA